MARARTTSLGVASGAALYVGAVLGPGALLLPALAAQAAGPASVLAWVGLLAASLAIAATFAALGVRHPVAGGAAAYVRAAWGRLPAAITGWWFYAGVVAGAPAVWLIGGFYVAHLTGGGRAAAVAAAAAMMVVVLGANAGGLHATARMQLGLAALLAALLLVAVASALPSAHAANWTPFAPHGWLAVGTAANLLMLSFVGWEAVAHLAGNFADPRRDLPRAMLAAFAIVAVLYLGLAVTTVAVLGGAPGSTVPLADLMQRGLGGAASALTAGAAVLLTVGTTNAYVAGATRLATSLAADARCRAGWRGRGRLWRSSGRPAWRSSVCWPATWSTSTRSCARSRRASWPSTSPRRRPASGCWTGACARPPRCRWRSSSSCSPSRGPTSRRLWPSRCWRAPSSAPVRVAQPGGDLQRSWLSCSPWALGSAPGEPGCQAQRVAPAIRADGRDVELHAQVGPRLRKPLSGAGA